MEYRYADIPALASILKARRASAQELADEALRLLADVGAAHNAVAEVLPDRARAEATAADRRISAGDESLLNGIPHGVKDLFAARGGHTTWGSPSFAGQVVEPDAAAVRRLQSAGSVLIAKLAMAELAGGGRAARPGASLHGQTRNPWNPARYSGGSSGGSAVAVAIGSRALRARDRDRRVDPRAGRLLGGNRPAADIRARTASRLDDPLVDPRQGRPARPLGRSVWASHGCHREANARRELRSLRERP